MPSSILSFKRRDDPFDHLFEEAEAAEAAKHNTSMAPRTTSSFLQRVVSTTSSTTQKQPKKKIAASEAKAMSDYASPFRAEYSNVNVQNEKTRRFPTVSATSNYTLKNPKQKGFTTIKKGQNFAKDIYFPNYLTENEQRQQAELLILEKKEKDLKYLQDSQNIIDLTKKQEPKKAPTPVASTTEEIDEATFPHSNISEEINPDYEDEEQSSAQNNEQLVLVQSEEEIHTPNVVEPPIDPALAPMVPFSLATPNQKSKKETEAPEKPSNPVASPTNQEEIVKTAQFGYLSKAVYDKIQYDEQQHKKWLADYETKQNEKYEAKMQEYKKSLQDMDNQMSELNDLIEKCELDTKEKIDVMHGQLVKKVFDKKGVQINDKMKIFNETKQIKLEKLSEKENVLNDNTEVKQTIDELTNEKNKVRSEYDNWTTNMTNIGSELDAKLFKISQINVTQMNLQNKIDALTSQKNNLQDEIAKNKNIHDSNVKLVESVDNKEYLPKLNDIDNEINGLLNQMTIVKQENANEKVQLAEITKKLEDERRAHEEQLQLEAEERKRQEENLLGKQRDELEAKANTMQVNHQQEIDALKNDYETKLEEFKNQLKQEQDQLDQVKRQKTRLEGEKALDEQKRQKDADDVLKNEIFEKQHKQAEAYSAAQLKGRKHPLAALAREITGEAKPSSKDNSLYDYETEEDVMYV